MTRRIISTIVLIAFVPYATGCVVHRGKRVPPSALSGGNEKIVAVIYPDGKVVKFDKNGGWYVIHRKAVMGYTEDGLSVAIPVDSLLSVRVERVDPVSTVLASLCIAALVLAASVGLIAATKESCPFVYSYDGDKYVFDAEPLGGAVCRGLARVDYSRLEHLRPVDGSYRVMLRNEVEETQHIDEMKLVVFDHEPNQTILPDYFGNFYEVESAQSPSRAVDEQGNDLRKFVERPDGISWQSLLPTDETGLEEALRHEITFEFPKPSDAASVVLVVNFGTAAWGSNMIREMLQLRGDKVDEWYEAVGTGGEAYRELLAFNDREELYLLKFYVREGDGWKFRGWIHGGGPFITEDLAIPVDLSLVPGDTVAVRVNPPRGFWTIDYIALANHAGSPTDLVEAPLAYSVDQDGKNLGDVFDGPDDKEYVMPRVGDTARIEFMAPPQREGSTRSIFLKTRGFYEIHIDKMQPEQTALIREGLLTEGKIVEYSLDQFRKLYNEVAGKNAGSGSAD